jgi:hypothetical protein
VSDARRAAAAARRAAELSRQRGVPEPLRTLVNQAAPWVRNRLSPPKTAARALKPEALRRARFPMLTLASDRLPLTDAFLERNRALGIDHVLCVTTAAADPPEAPDLSWIRPRDASAPTLLGAVNHLAHRWLSGRWTLFLMPHEVFVFPRMETRRLADLAQHLDDDRRRCLHAAVIDVYSDAPCADLGERYARERLFDPEGYFQFAGLQETIEIRGGPLARIAFAGAPHRAPMLQRIVFVRWEPHFRFLRFRQQARPLLLNRAHKPWEVSITAALLRHGALEDGRAAPGFAEGLGFEDEIGRIDAPAPAPGWLDTDFAARFDGSAALTARGLMGPGRWF